MLCHGLRRREMRRRACSSCHTCSRSKVSMCVLPRIRCKAAGEEASHKDCRGEGKPQRDTSLMASSRHSLNVLLPDGSVANLQAHGAQQIKLLPAYGCLNVCVYVRVCVCVYVCAICTCMRMRARVHMRMCVCACACASTGLPSHAFTMPLLSTKKLHRGPESGGVPCYSCCSQNNNSRMAGRMGSFMRTYKRTCAHASTQLSHIAYTHAHANE